MSPPAGIGARVQTTLGSDPSTIFGLNLTLWLLASKGTTFGGGGALTAWADQSGNNHNFIGAAGPTVGVDSNGNTTLVASGSDARLTPASVLNWGSLITRLNYTVWYVWSYSGNQTNDGFLSHIPAILCDGVSPPQISFGAAQDSGIPGNEQGVCYGFDTGASAYVINTSATGPKGVLHYCIAVMSAGTNLKLILDGTSITNTPYIGPPAVPTSMTPQLFGNTTSSFSFYNGDITEIGTTNVAASGGQTSALEAYLKSKYHF